MTDLRDRSRSWQDLAWGEEERSQVLASPLNFSSFAGDRSPNVEAGPGAGAGWRSPVAWNGGHDLKQEEDSPRYHEPRLSPRLEESYFCYLEVRGGRSPGGSGGSARSSRSNSPGGQELLSRSGSRSSSRSPGVQEARNRSPNQGERSPSLRRSLSPRFLRDSPSPRSAEQEEGEQELWNRSECPGDQEHGGRPPSGGAEKPDVFDPMERPGEERGVVRSSSLANRLSQVTRRKTGNVWRQPVL